MIYYINILVIQAMLNRTREVYSLWNWAIWGIIGKEISQFLMLLP